jgi:hypothetical protein
MATELTNASFAIFSTKNGANQADELTFSLLLNACPFNELFESDEGKNGGIIIVDGCKRGVVGGEILALEVAVKIETHSPSPAAFDYRRMSVDARGRWQ